MGRRAKVTLFSVLGVVGALVLGAGGYVGYIVMSYSRIGNVPLDIRQNSTREKVHVGDELKCTTYNLGFGAYSQDFTFFMDTGYDEQGNKTKGHKSKADNKASVYFNIYGAVDVIKNMKPDFAFFQEVDIDSTRSFNINQDEIIQENFLEYDSVFANNFHTSFLPYPLHDMHGEVQAGLTTVSKYKVKEAHRKEYTVSSSLSKLFDLDRCFSYVVCEVDNGKNLYMVNSHMSAYDKGGVIKTKQMQELNEFLKACKEEGDYVVVGGDFNNDLVTFNPKLESNAHYNTTNNRVFGETKKDPDWVMRFFNEDETSPLIEGYQVIASDNAPTCRNNDIKWEKGKTYTTVVDGFIVSSNITVTNIKNVTTEFGNLGTEGFAFSDHEPVRMEFKLNA